MTKAAVILFAALAVISGCADGKVTSETKPAETTTPAGTEKKGAAEVRTAEDLAGKKVIAFTFDDGPNTKATAELLDIAEEYGVKFSFFVIGQNISEESAAVMKRAHDMGCEINSHSFTHSYMDKMSAEDIKDEMQRTSDLIFEHTGELPHFFRPPYIAVNRTMYDSIDLPFICGIGCDDWNDSVSEDKRYRFLTEKCPDGCIVLLHDQTDNQKTVSAVRRAVPELMKDGFEFVTVTELFNAKGVTPENGVLYSYATATGWAG